MGLFTSTFERKPKRSTKNLSHSTIFDCGFGRLVPTNFEELASNDKFIIQHSNFIQPTSLYAPAFTKIRVRQRTFAVPLHHLYGYSYLEDFYADDKGEMLEPYTTIGDLAKISYPDPWNANAKVSAFAHGSLLDYCNVSTMDINAAANFSPKSPLADFKVSIIKLMSYLKIWNDWYRDENYQPDLQPVIDQIKDLPTFPYVSYTDLLDVTLAPDLDAIPLLEYLITPRFANVGKDYFNGVLPSQQAGDPVTLPVGDQAPIIGKNMSGADWLSVGYKNINSSVNDVTDDTIQNASSSAPNKFAVVDGQEYGLDLYADLRSAAGINIVEFRTLQAAQQWKEQLARGGRRLPELLRSRFGAHVPDAFIDRSIYVGGTVEDVKIDTIFATTAAQNQNLGDYAGRAYCAGNSKYFGYFGHLPVMMVTIQTILPVPQYWQGIRRDNFRLTNFDKINPLFAHIGEQPVSSVEFFVNYTDTTGFDKDSIFGYVPRYADWMVHLDEVHGNFRGSLNNWTTALNLPDLDSNNTPVNNVELTPQLLTQGYYKDANRIFAYNPNVEALATPFRCVVQFDIRKTTSLPKHPHSY